MPKTNNPFRVAVIGAGAAGLLAAGKIGENPNAAVTIYEKNRQVGRKVAITGKGRCNVTNNCEPEEFLRNVVANPRFLYGAVNGFPPSATMELFESLGVPLKTERGRRVFPVSEKAYDIVDALRDYALAHAKLLAEAPVRAVTREGEDFAVTAGDTRRFDAVLIATGGASYPLTGSTGDGYRLAGALGHTVLPPVGSLVPIEAQNAPLCASMMGLSLKNVGLRVEEASGKCLYEDFGEMLFTHFGLSGPMILSASAHLRERDLSTLTAKIDLKPALDEQKLDARLVADLAAAQNKDFVNLLAGLLPAKMCEPFARLSGIDPHKKANAVTREERKTVLKLLKHFPVALKRLRPIDEAVITAGGVSVKEVEPKSMQSKLCPGLYFAGEILDVDGVTGGYNLQIAFSTAAQAARAISAAANERSEDKSE